jgi:hypothetical protein
MLCVHGLNIVLVLMVARRMDRHVPSTWQVRDKKRKVLHYHRVTSRGFQRPHTLRTIACRHRCSVAPKEEGGVRTYIPSRMRVSRHERVPAQLAKTFCSCTILAVLRIDCAIHVFGNVVTDPIGASWWRVCFSPIEIALGIICCCATNVSPRPLWNRERPSLPTESTGLRCLKFRTTSGSSSTSNLNPASWVGGPKPQVNAFVTLENSSKEMDGVGGVGGIKVTKDYQLDRGKI